ncbi:hypothetical protein ACFQS3_09110 [Glycomyces mayteni]|uniref:Uncharacterized protein n=1 Tax=Glycomyces mayteni TaxID=543887 RepID=A0ABW2D4V8_9ACTN|nr:hypothetical protein GCM10025732_27810 [Glycomyces mayteni]
MTTKSRLLTSLFAAFAMVLAGLSIAGTATAAPSGADAETTAVSEVEAAAQCQLGAVANNAVKSGSNVRASGNIRIGGTGCSGTYKVLIHASILTNGVWVPVKTFEQTVYAPYSGYFSTAASCKRGQWISHIIVQRSGQSASDVSDSRLTVNSC